MKMKIEQLPALQDNYIYILQCPTTNMVAVVDPGDAEPVEQYLHLNGLKLDLILCTHHHGDHTGGVATLNEKYKAHVIGSRYDLEHGHIPGQQQGVDNGEIIKFGDIMFEVIETPGHTQGHICFWSENENVLFCGDTLFGAGCGRLLEGSAAELYTSLWQLKGLPLETLIYCGHEYTQKNLEFALSLLPDDVGIQTRLQQVKKIRSLGQSTIPSTLAEEMATNVFLRAGSLDGFIQYRAARDKF